MPLCAARFYIFESAFFLIFEVRLFSARGDAHIERFIFSLPAYRLAFSCPFAARFLRSFAHIPAVVFVLPKTFPFTFSLRLFLSFKNLPVVSCLPARGRSRFLFQSAFRKPVPLVDKFPRYVL